MTLQQFIDKYNGQKVDFDHQFGNQCVDLYRFYLQELNLPQTSGVAGAYQLFDTWPLQKVKNTPLGVPQPGDIMIWNNNYGQYGHVGIFVSGNVLSFTAFEQNDPTGSGCHLKSYSYRNVIGWLKPPLPLDNLITVKTQNKGGELRLVFAAGNPASWEKICKENRVDPTVINENVKDI